MARTMTRTAQSRSADLAARFEVLRERAQALPAAPARTTTRAARRLNRASGLLALSVLADSAVEHYRGGFENKAMFTPLVVSGLALAVSAHGTVDRRSAAHTTRDGVYALTALTGIVGTGFHVYNVGKRPGRFAWQNLFYGAPLGAPAAIMLSGAFGVCSERLRAQRGAAPRVFGLPAGRALAALSALGLLGSSAEAALLHFRGAYQNPAMFAPVTMPPVGALLLLDTALRGAGRDRGVTRWWMRGLSALGFVGVGFHAWGVHRSMGGWRNWRQNLLDGPPLPAPPSFTGLALAGLAALGLLEDHPDG